MAKIIKRIEIILELDEETALMTRTANLSENLNRYEAIGLLDDLRIEVIQSLRSQAIQSEVKPNEPAA